jgi:GntR family transcriptional regulator
VPYYIQIKEQILNKIINDLKVGDKIQNEMELCEIFGASRPTIRQAIKELENEGFLNRKKSFGTFVRSNRIKTSLMQDISFFTEELKARNIKYLNVILKKEKVIPKKEISEILNIKRDDVVNYIERLRLITQQPLYLTMIYIPDKLCPDFIDNDFVNDSSTELIEKKYNISLKSIRRYLYPVNKKFNPRVAKLLAIRNDEPFFYMISTLFDKDASPIGYYKDYFSSIRNEFSFYIQR